MIQINYGSKNHKGFIEILSQQLNQTFIQPMDNTLTTQDWLSCQGVDLHERTKDRIDFNTLRLCLMEELGHCQTYSFYLELQQEGLFQSNEATLSLANGYSGEAFQRALTQF